MKTSSCPQNEVVVDGDGGACLIGTTPPSIVGLFDARTQLEYTQFMTGRPGCWVTLSGSEAAMAATQPSVWRFVWELVRHSTCKLSRPGASRSSNLVAPRPLQREATTSATVGTATQRRTPLAFGNKTNKRVSSTTTPWRRVPRTTFFIILHVFIWRSRKCSNHRRSTGIYCRCFIY